MEVELVERAQRGDAEAFDALARLVGDRCLAIAVRIPMHPRKELEGYLDCGLLCRGRCDGTLPGRGRADVPGCDRGGPRQGLPARDDAG